MLSPLGTLIGGGACPHPPSFNRSHPSLDLHGAWVAETHSCVLLFIYPPLSVHACMGLHAHVLTFFSHHSYLRHFTPLFVIPLHSLSFLSVLFTPRSHTKCVNASEKRRNKGKQPRNKRQRMKHTRRSGSVFRSSLCTAQSWVNLKKNLTHTHTHVITCSHS